MWGLLDKSISESVPVMTWVWQGPPVFCVSVCFLASPWFPSRVIYAQFSDSCCPILLLWATVHPLGRRLRAQWGLGITCGLFSACAGSQFSFPPHPTVSSAGTQASASEQSPCSVSGLIAPAVFLFVPRACRLAIYSISKDICLQFPF